MECVPTIILTVYTAEPILNPIVLGHAAEVPAGAQLVGDLGQTLHHIAALGVGAVAVRGANRPQLRGLIPRHKRERFLDEPVTVGTPAMRAEI